MIRMSTIRHAVARIAFAMCLAVSAAAIGQTGERKPPPATNDRATKGEQSRDRSKSERPPPAQPDARSKNRGNERIRLDAPVSFPVDI